MANKILDNGTLITLGLVGIVAAAGALSKRGSMARNMFSFGTTTEAKHKYVATLAEAVKRMMQLEYQIEGVTDEVALGKPEHIMNDAYKLEAAADRGAKIPLLLFYAEDKTPQVGVFMFPDIGPEVWPAKYQYLSGNFDQDMRTCLGLVQAHLIQASDASEAGLYGSRASSSSFAAHPFGWAQVKGGHVVKVSDAERKPTGTGWGAVASSGTRIGDVAYLDGGDVYLRHRMGKDSEEGSMAAKAPKSDYEVIVGNVGTVYRGTSFSAAQKDFATYREQSQSGYGRAGGESVTLMRDGEIIREFDGEGEGSMARKNSTRRDVLQEDARKSGYSVDTYSPGDGTTRYKFFSLAEMARQGISEREQSYFGPLNGVHTALGLAAAKKWLARAPSTHSSSEGSMARKNVTGTHTYAVAIVDQPDGWDVSAKSLKEAVTEAVQHVFANEADPVGTRFHIRRSDQSRYEGQTYEVTDSGHARRLGMGSMARTGAPSARHIVATVHDGTDYGVFKASAEDIRLGDDMSHEQAVKTAKRSAANQKGARWYDFGDTEYNEEGKGGSMARTSPRFAALVRGKLPGALLDTEDMSVSTLRQYERNGWIRRSGAKDPRSWAYVTLTRDGYSAGN